MLATPLLPSARLTRNMKAILCDAAILMRRQQLTTLSVQLPRWSTDDGPPNELCRHAYFADLGGGRLLTDVVESDDVEPRCEADWYRIVDDVEDWMQRRRGSLRLRWEFDDRRVMVLRRESRYVRWLRLATSAFASCAGTVGVLD
jgi:hypothetical protein